MSELKHTGTYAKSKGKKWFTTKMVWGALKNMAGTNTLNLSKFVLILTSFPLFSIQ